MDSIYNVVKEKVEFFVLSGDSSAMCYAACLKKKFINMKLSSEQRSEVLFNSLIVNFLQIAMIYLIWDFAFFRDDDDYSS